MSNHVALLADLVRRPSVNPMGRDVAGPEYLEGRVADYLVQRFTAAGIPWARQPVSPGRDNVIARLDATVPRPPVVLWDAHQDTVPADGMTIDPFSPLVRDGRMYGRGSCDVKGGMAAMIAALERLATRAGPRQATVVFVATVNEEFGFSGARAVCRLWAPAEGEAAPATDGPARRLLGRRPAIAVVAEPTSLDLVMQHKGAVRWRVLVHGRACHSAFPEQGASAIYPAARAALALEQLGAELLRRHVDHPCGPPTLNVGTIRGGAGVNLVPDLAVLEVERRLLPDESADEARREAIARVASACDGARIEHEEPFIESGGLPDATTDRSAAKWVTALEAEARRHGAGRRIAARYGTNASVYARTGIPGVVFGPGSIAQAHTPDEWIDLEQVDQAAAILAGIVSG